MLISYLVIKWIRYNSLEATWKTDKQATRKSPCTYLIDRLQAYTDKLIGKKDKPPSCWFHFCPASSFNVQKQFVRLKDAIILINEEQLHRRHFAGDKYPVVSVWNKNRGTTDYGLRNTTRTQSVVPVLYCLNPVPQDSSEYSVQLYPSNSISDFD